MAAKITIFRKKSENRILPCHIVYYVNQQQYFVTIVTLSVTEILLLL